MSRQKRKGTAFESAVVNYLRLVSGDTESTIHREVLHGNDDQGDVTGLLIHGEPAALEVKNHSRLALATWWKEVSDEAGNIDSPYPFVIFHRKGKGLRPGSMGDQYVLTDLKTLARIANHGILEEVPE
ncbi:hypothetical protein [Bifidobacterium aquikefiri]|uniref:hypothetical protein n=1 Tax=Bifidobacterium aquikefiri TaxID=1653207 RepID=UPI0039ED501B